MSVKNRNENYSLLSQSLTKLNDQQILQLIEQNHTGSYSGKTAIFEQSGITIFTKLIPLTDRELAGVNYQSNNNLYNLPMHYQYGIGSRGFNAWRELKSHTRTTNWVLKNETPNFPLLYHWRIISHNNTFISDQTVKKELEFWENSAATKVRLIDLQKSNRSLVICIEYFPFNLSEWLKIQIKDNDAYLSACKMILRDMTASFQKMKKHNFVHFDAHFKNILTDGKQLYLSDFGLALSKDFLTTNTEKDFLLSHEDYDRYSTQYFFIHSILSHHYGEENWINGLNDPSKALPHSLTTFVQSSSELVLLIHRFYQELKNDKSTPYPKQELDRAFQKIEFIAL